MFRESRDNVGSNWVKTSVLLALVAVFFVSGYWVGQKSNPQSGTTQKESFLSPKVGGNPLHPAPSQMRPGPSTGDGSNAQFRQESASLAKHQRVISEVSSQGSGMAPGGAPSPVKIPANASPQLRTFLTTRDQLLQDQQAFLNLHRNDDPATRKVAMQQWRQQNVARFQLLQHEVQALAQNNASASSNGGMTPK